MPTYHEILTTDLSALNDSADRWESMAGKFEKQEGVYRDKVYGISMGQTWEGLSADAANATFKITLKEFKNAQTEAKAVASLLRDAHTQFVTLKGKLQTARDEAIAADMQVSDQGLVRYDYSKLSEGEKTALRHDLDYQASISKAVRSWQDHIDQAVRAVTEADDGVRIALKAVVVDSNTNDGTEKGFNADAKGDIEKYEADEVRDIALRINHGEKVSGKELSELQRAFRDNGDDKAFGRTLLDGLGARGTIQFTNRLNDLAHVRDTKHAGDYTAIETGLSNSLATATKDTKSSWYKDWRADMQKAGVARYETDSQGARLDKARGYQSLITLMQHGGGYEGQVLQDLSDDMIEAEKKNPDIWDLKHEYAGKRDGWFANDPVDGALGLMSHDPKTAADYLSDDHRMKYLMHDRDWNVTIHGTEAAKATVYSQGLDADDRVGLGAALQAGATGMDPSDEHAKYVEHSDDNKHILKSSVKYLADEGDKFPPSLRDPMAKVFANHGSTIHEAMSSANMAHSPVPQDELYEVTKQISKSQDSYADLNSGLNHAMVNGVHESGQQDPKDSLTRAGRTVGFLEQARVDAAGDPEVAEFKSKWIVDKAVSYIPVASDDVQAGVDYVTDKWLADEQQKLDDKAADENVAHYENRNEQLMALAEEWRKSHGSDSSSEYGPEDAIDQAATAGIERARGVSGESAK
ncbi:hypothetical protein OKJ48_36410 [Streptomyces kunmingensis]|uniref:Uncharacterized protein n=1 Tax=Streptomyces kunmingensis TaxID=68225 RepID=A0ABU6CLS0_9ACTN|nr:hypothetical protein [Streptomyces kunmingensis]MEB3965666.1 hypothetical protein [Streptomyces kunmingensis]